MQTQPPQDGRTGLFSATAHPACLDCHDSESPRPGAAGFTQGLEPSAICVFCHAYQENHHPVNFTPVASFDDSMPLFGGEVRCLTCHEVHGGAKGKGTPNLLRGGPFTDRRESCFMCHDQEAYAAINPHQMLDERGDIRQLDGRPVCLVCHSVKPDPAVDRTDDVRFRADVGFLCWRCHPPMPGTFFDEHFLVTPEQETLQHMRDSEAGLRVILPLVPRGRITCSTCHNPHQQGIMQHEPAAKGAGAKYQLRLQANCTACHAT